VVFAGAAGLEGLIYPIAELGGCESKEACKAYCDAPGNGNACLEFGLANNLILKEEADKTREREKELRKTGGPGGCITPDECKAYCADEAHLKECLDYGEKHGLIDSRHAEVAKNLASKNGPGGCRGANECRAYCEDEAHNKECVVFAHRQGLISDQRAEIAKKISGEGGPGGCREERACHEYCADPSHVEECMAFAETHNLISKEETVRARKMSGREGPGGCRGEACREYCESPDRAAECIEFAEKNGFMTAKEAERARKFASKPGPGGCRGEACKAYCEETEHQEECLAFAEREGFLPKEEIERAKKFMQIARDKGGPGGCRSRRECQEFCKSEENRKTCFDFAKKNKFVSGEEQEHIERGLKLQEQVKNAGGPGGCRAEGECKIYCSDPSHVEECAAFAVSHGGFTPEEAKRMLEQFLKSESIIRSEIGARKEDFKRAREEHFRRFEEFRELESRFRGEEGFFEGGIGNEQRGPKGKGVGPGNAERNFSGPNGCSSPAECIKYCIEHKEECASFGEPGRPDARPGEGGLPPGRDLEKGGRRGVPQDSQNLQNLPPEERKILEEKLQKMMQRPEGVRREMLKPQGERGFAPQQDGHQGNSAPRPPKETQYSGGIYPPPEFHQENYQAPPPSEPPPAPQSQAPFILGLISALVAPFAKLSVN
ncbi:MAG: hypothetical protein AAB846_02030, partial [Patescibacteria group bacterium]